jgi:hypothetical protein
VILQFGAENLRRLCLISGALLISSSLLSLLDINIFFTLFESD